jgi:PTH1 family peptidyl-tRNA hydrolase
MKLIIGLGNPGKKYKNTRHNIGFIVLDKFANLNNVKITKKKFNSLYNILPNDVVLVKPESFMNLSGVPAKGFVDYYKINSTDLIIIHDDVDLEFGRIKIKYSGGDGGHKGLASIINELNESDFIRLRIGIGRPESEDVTRYVLKSFTKEEIDILYKDILDRSCLALDLILDKGFEFASNKINTRR